MLAVLLALFLPADAPKTAKEAFQPLNPLIGSWKGTGSPEGTREEKQKGFWTETVAWEWQFKGKDTWLDVTFDKGKHFTKWELRYQPDKTTYHLTATTPDKKTLTFAGPLAATKQSGQVLTLDRTDADAGETQRLVVTLLHHNRFLYRYETKPTAATAFTKKYQVGATKEGESFADVPKGPECIVSGGKGTIAVSHNGKTYYVCCSGCRDEFKSDPEKYIKAAAKEKK